jgi:O-antigen ligase
MSLNFAPAVKRPPLRTLSYAALVALTCFITGIVIVVFNTGPVALLIPIGILLILKVEWGFYTFIASIPIEAAINSDIFSLPKILGFIAMAGFFLSVILRKRKVYWDTPLILMVLFEIWGLLSYLWSKNPGQTLSTSVGYFFLALLYFLIINQVRSIQALNMTMIAFFIGAVLMVGSGSYELFSGTYLANVGGRLEGLTGNANIYAIEALVGILGVYWVWMKNQSKIVHIFLILFVCLLGATFVTTLSRGGVISLAVFGLMLVLLHKDRTRWAVLLAVVALLIAFLSPASLWERFMEIPSETRIVDLWPAGLNIFQQNPWIGYGLGTSPYLIGQAVPFVGSGFLVSVHSAPLAVAIDVGIFGLLLYLVFMMIPTLKLLSAYLWSNNEERNDKLSEFAVVLISVLVAYLFSWVKGGGLETGKLLWLLLGLESSLVFLIKPMGKKIDLDEASNPV